MKKNSLITIILFGSVIAITVASRLLPHPYNITSLGALALVSGVYVRSRWGIFVPLITMIATDLVKGWHELVLFTWGSILLMTVLGWWIRKHKTVGRIAGGALAGSVLFYLITNAAVWAFTPLYAKTAAGLVQCFYMALPFFRNTVAGDLLFALTFISLFEASRYLASQPAKKQVIPVKF